MKRLLVVVDMQNDFVTGPLGTPEAQAAVPYVVDLIKEEHAKGRPVMFTKDLHFDATYGRTLEGVRIPEHCMYRTEGGRLVPEVQAVTAFDEVNPTPDFFVTKGTFGASPDKLWKCLYEHKCFDAEEIELCGVCTDICVISNAVLLRTLFPNASIIVRSWACAGTTPEAHKAALTVMKSLLIDVWEEKEEK